MSASINPAQQRAYLTSLLNMPSENFASCQGLNEFTAYRAINTLDSQGNFFQYKRTGGYGFHHFELTKEGLKLK